MAKTKTLTEVKSGLCHYHYTDETPQFFGRFRCSFLRDIVLYTEGAHKARDVYADLSLIDQRTIIHALPKCGIVTCFQCLSVTM